jgi:hypothetical protein
MEPEPTPVEPPQPNVDGLPSGPDPFGIRPSRARPHSISLFRASAAPLDTGGLSRGADLLIGVGLGAAAMYYLDPDHGAARRAQLRDKIVRAISLLNERRRDLRGSRRRAPSALAPGATSAPSEVTAEPTAR